MSNTWFQFRQFRIEQEQCAMKITTDACIQGAWTPIEPHVQRVLDIGAGTSLLSLMLAQRAPGITIDAVEYDAAAAAQAADNIAASPWKERINLIQGDARNYTASYKYDLIICNPPFFTGSLLSDKQQKNLARHDISLSKEDLLAAVTANLAEKGYLSLLLPYTEYLQWIEPAAKLGLQATQCLHIKHKPGAPVKRVVSIMAMAKERKPDLHELVIKNEHGVYTPGFKELLQAFYLDLL